MINVTKEWFEKYNRNRDKLICPIDLESYFSKKEIAGLSIDVINIGDINLPTGDIIACDPFVDLDSEALSFIQKAPCGKFPVEIAVICDEERYAAVRVKFTDKKAVKYELGLVGEEDIDSMEEDEFYGFGVDAGMGCIIDAKARDEYVKYLSNINDDNIYDNLFSDLLEKSYQKYPKYQRSLGDWLNWEIPGTELNIAMFASGFGDGYYPSYFGYDENGDICSFIIHFIDIEAEYDESDMDEE